MKALSGKLGKKERVVVVRLLKEQKKQMVIEMRANDFNGNGNGNFSVLFLFLLFILVLFVL